MIRRGQQSFTPEDHGHARVYKTYSQSNMARLGPVALLVGGEREDDQEAQHAAWHGARACTHGAGLASEQGSVHAMPAWA